MKKVIRFSLPPTERQLRRLKAGDEVFISGALFTARDQAHQRLAGLLKRGGRPPFALANSFIYYTGATPAPPGRVIGSCGPTTSSRMDAFTPLLLSRGVKGVIGKGERSEEVIASLKKYRAVYFVALGGAGALLSAKVKAKELVAYPDLGTEAIYRLAVENFPVFVGIDTRGGNIYRAPRKCRP